MLADIPEMNVYPESEVSDYLAGVSSGRNAGVQMLIDAGSKKGAKHQWLNNSTAIIDCKRHRILAYRYFGGESVVAASLYGDKSFTKDVWENAGVLTPRGRLVTTADEAIVFQQELGSSIVLKPRFSFASKGVSVNLVDESAIRLAFERAKRYSKGVLAEEFLEIQSEYRCFVGDGVVHAFVERLPPHVVGDGHSSISTLIDRRNQVRKTIPSTRNEPIEISGRVKSYLAECGRSTNTILSAGEIQQLSHMRILGEGGDLYGVLDLASDELKQLAIKAARAIPGAYWAGLDLIETPDGRVWAIEINSNAQTNGIRYPTYGKPEPIAEILLDERLKQTEKSPLSSKLGISPRISLPTPGRDDTPFILAIDDPQEVVLHKLFHRWLVADGYELNWINGQIVRVCKNQESHWFRGCLSPADLAVVNAVVKKHALVRRALGSAKVPRVSGKLIRTLQDLRDYLGQQPEPVSVTAHSMVWKDAKVSACATPADAPKRQTRAAKYGYWVQEIPKGTRLRVLSSGARCFAVLGEQQADSRSIKRATREACRAVRAIPGLRWAAVDVVISEHDGKTRPRVEGLSVTPQITAEDRLLAGELEGFYSYILGSSE